MNTYTITITFRRHAKFKSADSIQKWLTWFLGRGGAGNIKVEKVEGVEEAHHDVA